LSKRTEKSHQKIEKDALPLTRSGRGPFELALHRHREEVARAMLELHLGMEFGDEMQRRDLQQHVVADVAFDAEAVRGRIELRARAELHGVRGDREIGFAGEARVVARRERDRDARELRQVGRWREARMQTADGQHERRPRTRAPARPQRHGASQRIRVREPRIHQHAVDRHRALVEVDHTDRVDVDTNDVVVARWQQCAHPAEHQQALAHAELDDDRKLEHDERGREPSDLRQDADQIAAASRRERRRERADDRRRVRHRIARKQQLAQRVVLQPFAQHVLVERAVDRDHAADTEQREAHAELDRPEILGGDEHDDRVAAAAVGHPRRDQAEGRHRELIEDRHLQHARVRRRHRDRGTGSRRRSRCPPHRPRDRSPTAA
jgi:hypothetical protein